MFVLELVSLSIVILVLNIGEPADAKLYLIPGNQTGGKWQEFSFQEKNAGLGQNEVDHVMFETTTTKEDKKGNFCVYETVKMMNGSCVTLKKFHRNGATPVNPTTGKWIQEAAGRGATSLKMEPCPVSSRDRMRSWEDTRNGMDNSSFQSGDLNQHRGLPRGRIYSLDPPEYSSGGFQPLPSEKGSSFSTPGTSARGSPLSTPANSGRESPVSTPASSPPPSQPSSLESTSNKSNKVHHEEIHQKHQESMNQLSKLIHQLMDLIRPLLKLLPFHHGTATPAKSGAEEAEQRKSQ